MDFFISFKHDSVCQLQEIVVRPDVQFVGVVHKACDIILHLFDIRCGQLIAKLTDKGFLVDFFTIKLTDALLEMGKVERDIPRFCAYAATIWS